MTTTKKSAKVDIANLPYEIIKVVQANIETLKKHPKHLSWCLMCYDLMHYACRYSGTETNNPKYIFLDEKEWPTLNKEEMDFLYEAWGVTVSNHIPNDNVGEIIPKPNMTLDQWVELFTNPEYQYSNMFPNRHSVINKLLCVNGTGLDWNKDGFISDGSNGVDEIIFQGYSQAEKEVDPVIVNQIKEICNKVKKVKIWFDIIYQTAVEFNQLTGSQKSKFRHEILFRSAGVDLTKDKTYFLQAVRNAKKGVFKRKKDDIDKLMDKLRATTKKVAKSIGKNIDEVIEEFDNNKPVETEQTIATREGIFFYPFSKNYCNMSKMPNNAHPSYITEGMKIAKLVVSGQAKTYGDGGKLNPATDEMISVSKAFIKKWEPKGY